MTRSNIFIVLTIIFILLPSSALAATVEDVIQTVSGIVTLIVPIVVALAMLFFFWGLAQFILNADNEQKRSEGKQIMIWGIIALFVMMSVWGLVKTLQLTFGVDDSSAIPPPKIEPL